MVGKIHHLVGVIEHNLLVGDRPQSQKVDNDQFRRVAGWLVVVLPVVQLTPAAMAWETSWRQAGTRKKVIRLELWKLTCTHLPQALSHQRSCPMAYRTADSASSS